jgi:hypothetical protein
MHQQYALLTTPQKGQEYGNPPALIIADLPPTASQLKDVSRLWLVSWPRDQPAISAWKHHIEQLLKLRIRGLGRSQIGSIAMVSHHQILKGVIEVSD